MTVTELRKLINAYNNNKITIHDVAASLEAYKPTFKGSKTAYKDSLDYMVEEMKALVKQTQDDMLKAKSERVVDES